MAFKTSNILYLHWSHALLGLKPIAAALIATFFVQKQMIFVVKSGQGGSYKGIYVPNDKIKMPHINDIQQFL